MKCFLNAGTAVAVVLGLMFPTLEGFGEAVHLVVVPLVLALPHIRSRNPSRTLGRALACWSVGFGAYVMADMVGFAASFGGRSIFGGGEGGGAIAVLLFALMAVVSAAIVLVGRLAAWAYSRAREK